MWGADYPHLEGSGPGPPPGPAARLRRDARGRTSDGSSASTPSISSASTAPCWQEVAARVGPDGGGPVHPGRAMDDIPETFSWSLARPVPLVARAASDA